MNAEFTKLWVAAIVATSIVCYLVFDYFYDRQAVYIRELEEELAGFMPDLDEFCDCSPENFNPDCTWYDHGNRRESAEFERAMAELSEQGLLADTAEPIWFHDE